MKKSYYLVLVTAPDRATARKLAHAALNKRLVACANIVPGLESHYWWQGRLDCSKEVLVLFKTVQSRLKALERLILSEHPYDTPEFIAFRIDSGTSRYLQWISQSVK